MTNHPSHDKSIPSPEFQPQKPTHISEDGVNISAHITRIILYYIQGIFMRTGLKHRFAYTEGNDILKRIYITDMEGFDNLAHDAYPRIRVQRGDISKMGRGGIGSFLELDQVTNTETKIDLFSGNISVDLFGAYDDIELYASMLFFSFGFLTKPLKYFTIFKIGDPKLGRILPYKKEADPVIYQCSVQFQVFKEGTATIEENHLLLLNKMALKCSQVFIPGSNERIVIRVS